MRTITFSIEGNRKSEIELPKIFSTKIREDIVAKYYEAEKFVKMFPYTLNPNAGRRHSASGTISHKRHDFKGHYGRGIARIPRKTMWRRGTQFFWIGAEISGTRGGRKAHPPKFPKRQRKINKQEKRIAMNSVIAATAKEDYLIRRYSTLNKLNIALPLIIESKLDNIKTKTFLQLLKSILKDAFSLAIKKKSIRAGKGKLRSRKYKSNAGILLIKSKDENIKIKGIDIKTLHELSISDLYPLGRLTLYTEKAIQELGEKAK